MRREGFELTIGRPRVLFKEDANGKRTEPIEEVIIDVDEEYSSSVIDGMNKRKAEMLSMKTVGAGKSRLIFHAPSRGLIGYQGKLLTETRGTAVVNRLFHSYDSYKGDIRGRRNGALVSAENGTSVSFALFKLQDRGVMFIGPQTQVYEGMIVGEHSKNNDLDINVIKGKQLTNMRASGSDKAVTLLSPRNSSLEEIMAYIKEDEMIEVTPKNLRLRKKFLCPNERKRHSKLA